MVISVVRFWNYTEPVNHETDIEIGCSSLDVSVRDRSGGGLLTGGFGSEYCFRPKTMAVLLHEWRSGVCCCRRLRGERVSTEVTLYQAPAFKIWAARVFRLCDRMRFVSFRKVRAS